MNAWPGKSRAGTFVSHTPRGYRAYAVGDVHGRLDLLDDLVSKIERDLAERKPRRALLLFLGDLIDRGPASAQVIERLRTYRHPDLRVVFLMGNHEEVLLRLLSGERGILQSWLRFGGAECLQSYGVDPQALRTMQEGEALGEVKRAVPDSHRKFIGSFADTLRFGDYLFVHAGIRPSVDLTMQSQTDLRWIRQPFLDDESDHGFIVVHGHTIGEEVVERPNRIGIDTGAYRSGVLTALVLDGSERQYLTANAPDGNKLVPE
jgi:serine/threonine protein phosphatase 1